MFFAMKKVIAALCQPLTFGLGLAILGFILLRSRKYARTGRCALLLGLLVLLMFGYPQVPGCMHKSLAGRYQPMTSEALREMPGGTEGVVWIAVLCGGCSTNWPFSIGARLEEASLARFVEGLRIYRQLPHGNILLSVGDLLEVPLQDRLVDQLAETVGIPRQDLRPVTGATCTQDEARLNREIVGTAPFVLVTSDYHMPRAMLLCKALGMNPVPAPAGQCGRSDGEPRFSPRRFFPNAANLVIADTALHEYLGMWWARLQGKGQ